MDKYYKKEFDDFLQNKHAEDYHGTDDDMPNAYDAWVSSLDSEEMTDLMPEFMADHDLRLLRKLKGEMNRNYILDTDSRESAVGGEKGAFNSGLEQAKHIILTYITPLEK